MNGKRRLASVSLGVVLAAWLAVPPDGVSLFAEEPVLRLHLMALGSGAPGAPWAIELARWSTEAERAPIVAALSAPPAPPADSVPSGRAAGRGGRGRGAAPPPSPLARLTSAVRAAPTLGFIWGDGVTGYSIKYAWRAPSPEGTERIVLVSDRRLGAHVPEWAAASNVAPEAGFTLIEMRIDGAGSGEGKTSLTTAVAVEAAAGTLALDGYAAAPVMLKVTR